MKKDLSHLEEFRSQDPNPLLRNLLPRGPGQGLFEIPIKGMTLRVTSNVGKEKDGTPETDRICVSCRVEKMGASLRLANDEELEEIKKLFWDEDEIPLVFKFDHGLKIFGNNNTIYLQKRKHDWKEL